MKSEFLNKFKGKTNKISKLGINKLISAFDDSRMHSQIVQKVNPKLSLLMQRSPNKQNIGISNSNKASNTNKVNNPTKVKNPNKQSKKNISYSFSQLQSQQNKQFQYKKRQVITIKQSNSYKQKQKKQNIKLPRIGKSIHPNSNILNEIKKIQINTKQRRNNTQIDQDKFFYFGTFLDHDVHQQLNKLNQFQNRTKGQLDRRNSQVQDQCQTIQHYNNTHQSNRHQINQHQINQHQIHKHQTNTQQINRHQINKHKKKGMSYHF